MTVAVRSIRSSRGVREATMVTPSSESRSRLVNDESTWYDSLGLRNKYRA
jgi:hypothetical protein